MGRAGLENRITGSGLPKGLEQKVPIRHRRGDSIRPVSAGRRPGIFCPSGVSRARASKVAWLLLCAFPMLPYDCSGRRMTMKADAPIEFAASGPPPPKGLAEPRRGRRKNRGVSNRSCRICGKDPHPNYFYCPACHHRISASGEGDLVD